MKKKADVANVFVDFTDTVIETADDITEAPIVAPPIASGVTIVTALVNKSAAVGGKMIHLVKGATLTLPADVAQEWKYHKYVE